jgi:hypothetical protein
VANDPQENDKEEEDLLTVEEQVESCIQDEQLELEHRENENTTAKRSRLPPKLMSDYIL